MSDFRQAYVGTNFNDALERLQENSLNEDIPELRQITNRDDNIITADEVGAALNSPVASIRQFAQMLIDNHRLFLLDVCNASCLRRAPGNYPVPVSGHLFQKPGMGTHPRISLVESATTTARVTQMTPMSIGARRLMQEAQHTGCGHFSRWKEFLFA